MKLTDLDWLVKASDVDEKEKMFDYAEKCGLPINAICAHDDDLYVGCGIGINSHKLFSYSISESKNRLQLITSSQFRDLCDEYAGWTKSAVVEGLADVLMPESKPLALDYLYGLNLIHDERERQVRIGRSTVSGDDRYMGGQLQEFAQYWLSNPDQISYRFHIYDKLVKQGWNADAFHYDSHTLEKRMAIAGALIAAELDRNHRLSHK